LIKYKGTCISENQYLSFPFSLCSISIIFFMMREGRCFWFPKAIPYLVFFSSIFLSQMTAFLKTDDSVSEPFPSWRFCSGRTRSLHLTWKSRYLTWWKFQ
jgi:hypothetical protein